MEVLKGITTILFLIFILESHAFDYVSETRINLNGRDADVYSPFKLIGKRAPVIVALHGGLTDSQILAEKIKFNKTLTRTQSHGVFINGTNQWRFSETKKTWNAGKCCGSAKEKNIDDLSYIKGAIIELIQRGIAARENISLLGSSNGSMMAINFACENHHLISNVYSLGGSFMSGGCNRASGVKFHFIHGQKDTTIPVSGGGKGELLAGEPFPSLMSVRRTLLNAGATSVRITILESGEHAADTLYQAAMREKGKDLGEIFIP